MRSFYFLFEKVSLTGHFQCLAGQLNRIAWDMIIFALVYVSLRVRQVVAELN